MKVQMMCRRSMRAGLLFAGLLVVGAVQLASAQSAATAPSAKPAATTPKTKWSPPRTPDGQPDLQGTWNNGTLTPFERPAALAGKAFLTEEEAAALERQAAERRANPNRAARPGDVGGDNEAFVDSGYKVSSTRQTSLVVDPPDGTVPIRKSALDRRDHNLASIDSYASMSPWDRCITRGPTGLFPAGYNNGYQIFQSAGYVVILAEMIHEVRVIPLDGRPHLNANIRLWSGDSRGHWEGTTLVVDTTNFNDRGWIATHAGSGRLRGVPVSVGLHLVERFTPTAADTIIYEMTIDDPDVYERSWRVSVPLLRNDRYQLFEYACHEGNQAMQLMLGGARTQEHETEAAAGSQSPAPDR
jgi:hypothetical protein